jgi:hypothetical protein
VSELRERPVRSRSWKPITKYGIIDTDRKYVLMITFACFSIPFLLELSVFRIPLPLPMALAGLALSVAFFKFIRLGRRPHWFWNRVCALGEDLRYLFHRGVRRALPRDEERRAAAWLTDSEQTELLTFITTGQLT